MRKQTKNIVSAETLTILRMISSSTNSSPEEVSSEWVSECVIVT
jgi:hypothetical protein